jgi:hypothetical protein
MYGGYDGGQAQFVRVPYANNGPRKVQGDFTDEELLFLTDILPTGYARHSQALPSESRAPIPAFAARSVARRLRPRVRGSFPRSEGS